LDSEAQNWTFPAEEIVKKQIRDWYKPWFDNRVIISGWEASINPKFSEYIKYAREIWYDRVQTVTNWNMFASEDFCKKVFEAWLQEVTFSFHGHNETLHDYLVATPWAFKKSLKWLIYIKKHFPEIIINIDIVVNKVNVKFLPDIIKFFMKLWVYEYDILQIIPFGRWFSENKSKLFYNIWENLSYLQETWKLSRKPWMYMWTNRFPREAFEWW
jgi:MoaA/NifB/PqqE/SkfB family radical SAM enzyme